VIGVLCPSISMVPEECANISGDTCGGHVSRLGECNERTFAPAASLG
jgi:hypothetical protein